MKLLQLFILMLLVLYSGSAGAQDFNEQIYYGYTEGSTEAQIGNLSNINDTLAEIRFRGTMFRENVLFACSFKFNNDTLLLTELTSPVDLNRYVEYSNTEYVQKKKDSIYLGYQVYYDNGGNANYDSLFFETGRSKTPNSGQCDSHCALIKRPRKDDFVITIWNGTVFLDQFEVHIPDSANVIRMSKEIFTSSGWGKTDEFLEKIPKNVEIDGKSYVLVIDIHPLHYFYEPQKRKIKGKKSAKK